VSQPALGTPIGRQSSSHSATPLTHLTCISHMRRSSAHRRAYPNVMAASPWTGMPHRGMRPPSLRAATPQRCTAARRCHGLAAPHLTHHSGHCDHHTRPPHPSPHGQHKQPMLLPRPSLQALHLGPWPMCEVRGSVAKIEVGPWAPGCFYHTVYSTACASAHFIISSPFSGLLHRLGTVDSHLSYHMDT